MQTFLFKHKRVVAASVLTAYTVGAFAAPHLVEQFNDVPAGALGVSLSSSSSGISIAYQDLVQMAANPVAYIPGTIIDQEYAVPRRLFASATDSILPPTAYTYAGQLRSSAAPIAFPAYSV